MATLEKSTDSGMFPAGANGTSFPNGILFEFQVNASLVREHFAGLLAFVNRIYSTTCSNWLCWYNDFVEATLAFLWSCCSAYKKWLFNLPYLGPWITLFASVLVSFVRLGCGNWAAAGLETCRRPHLLMTLYDNESDGGCRTVRETLSMLGLDVLIHPIAVSAEHSSVVTDPVYQKVLEQCKLTGVVLPVLVDPNQLDDTDTKDPIVLCETHEIVDYLWSTYGNTAVIPWNFRIIQWLEAEMGWMSQLFILLPLILRPELTERVIACSTSDGKLIELYGYENCPYSRMVRETLCTMNISYVLRNVPKDYCSKRHDFIHKFGNCISTARKLLNMITVPLLVDRKCVGDAGVALVESDVIIAYLIECNSETHERENATGVNGPATKASKEVYRFPLPLGNGRKKNRGDANLSKKKLPGALYSPVYAGVAHVSDHPN